MTGRSSCPRDERMATRVREGVGILSCEEESDPSVNQGFHTCATGITGVG